MTTNGRHFFHTVLFPSSIDEILPPSLTALSDHPLPQVFPIFRRNNPTMPPTITLLPEFHLTGFSQQEAITQSDAAILAEGYDGQVVVAGYVERMGNDFYSSAIVRDEDGSIYNVRKSEPWGNSEKAWISGSGHAPFVLDLSIGRTLVIICADAFETRYGARHKAQQLWGHEKIEWVLVPSHWQKSFEDMLIRRGVLRLVRALGNPEWIVSDTYHGRIDSSEWDE